MYIRLRIATATTPVYLHEHEKIPRHVGSDTRETIEDILAERKSAMFCIISHEILARMSTLLCEECYVTVGVCVGVLERLCLAIDLSNIHTAIYCLKSFTTVLFSPQMTSKRPACYRLVASDGLMPTEARGNYFPEAPYLRETKT